MKINRIEKLPKGFESYDSYPLDNYYFEDLPYNIKEIWYWYGSGDYCGTGHIVAVDDNDKWYHHDCGHCSCYGPTCDFDTTQHESFIALLDKCTNDLKDQLKPITELIIGEYLL